MIVTVFSGTSEGKEISHYLAELGISVNVSVATEYGKNVTPQQKNINIAVGRLNADEMLGFIKDSSFVIDATHPYAQIVTQNIKSACEVADIKYIRLLRDSVDSDKVIEAENISQAVEYLKHTQGKIFVSTGSKSLIYTQLLRIIKQDLWYVCCLLICQDKYAGHWKLIM